MVAYDEISWLRWYMKVISMDWFKGKFTGKPHIYWENLWFPVDFLLNQSIDFWDDLLKKWDGLLGIYVAKRG